MAHAFQPGEDVPTSGVYRITHAPPHPAMPEEVTAIKGRQFPSCPLCDHLTYELIHPALHVREVPPLFEPDDLKEVGMRDA